MKTWAYLLAMLRQSNWVLHAIVAILLGWGLLFIHSASAAGDDVGGSGLYRRQLVWGVAGALCYLGVLWTDYRRLHGWAPWLYAVSLVLLVLVLVAGSRIYGARRWLEVFGMSIQPSEFAKAGSYLLLARYLASPDEGGHVRRLFGAAAIAGVPFVLIAVEPDLGTAAVLLPVCFAMLFAGGIRLRVLGTVAALGLAVVGTVLALVVVPHHLGMDDAARAAMLERIGLSDYQVRRIETFANPGADPLGAGWNKLQSEIAVGSGGIWGKGYRRGTQNVLGFLPKSVAPTDFIFSVVAEETGFAGGLALLALFGGLVLCGLVSAGLASDRFGRLLCCGVTAQVFTHAFVNMGMTIGLLPITGVPLPLVSYGGSFLLSTMFGLGLIQSVHARAGRLTRF